MTKRLQEAINRLQEAVRGQLSVSHTHTHTHTLSLTHTQTDYSLTGLYDRLGVVAKKLNLKVDLQPGRTPSIFLVSDAFFYIEVCCQDNGTVSSVKLAQANTPPVSSTERSNVPLVNTLTHTHIHRKTLLYYLSYLSTIVSVILKLIFKPWSLCTVTLPLRMSQMCTRCCIHWREC